MTTEDTTWPAAARWAIRFGPPAVTLVALLFLFEPRGTLTPEVWALALVGSALVVPGGRWPLVVSLTESGLPLVSVVASPASIGIAQLLAGLALGELAMRRPWLPHLACGTAVACGVGTFYLVSQPDAEPVPTVLRLIMVGFPVLAGRHLRSLRELAQRYRRQGLDAARIRNAEVRAAREAERTRA